jgi:hypothetical protein
MFLADLMDEKKMSESVLPYLSSSDVRLGLVVSCAVSALLFCPFPLVIRRAVS